MIAPKGYTPLATIWEKISLADRQHFYSVFSATAKDGDHTDQMSPLDFCELSMLSAASPKLLVWRKDKDDPIELGSRVLVDAMLKNLPSNWHLKQTTLNGKNLRELMPIEIVRRARLLGYSGLDADGHDVLPIFWDRASYSISFEVWDWIRSQTQKLVDAWDDEWKKLGRRPGESAKDVGIDEWLLAPILDETLKVVETLKKLDAEGASLVIPEDWEPQFKKRWREAVDRDLRPKKVGRPSKRDRAKSAYQKRFPDGHKAAGISSWCKASEIIAKDIGEPLSERTLRDGVNGKSGKN